MTTEETSTNHAEATAPLRYHVDRIAALLAAAAGTVALVVGWLKISNTPYPAEQLPLILSAGIGGIFLLGLGATLWISSDLRDEWSKLDRIEGVLRDIAEDAASNKLHDASTASTNGGSRRGARASARVESGTTT